MNLFVIPPKGGIHIRKIARLSAWIPAFAGMTVLLLSACAHKADLKTPSQIKAAEEKAAAKAAKEKMK